MSCLSSNLEMILQANKLPSIDFLHFHSVLVRSSRKRCETGTTIVDQRTRAVAFSRCSREIYFAIACPCTIAADSVGRFAWNVIDRQTSVLRRRLTDERVRRLSSTRSSGHVPRNERKLWRKRDWERQPQYIGRAIPLGEANPVIGRSCNPRPPLPRERKLSSVNERFCPFPFLDRAAWKRGCSFSADELGWMLIEWESIRDWEIS